MEGKINKAQINYLASHLERFYEGPDLASCLEGLNIPLSEEVLNEEKVFFIEGVPVLFPMGEEASWFSSQTKGVNFHHDILKSAFYLLSGYQELDPTRYDKHGRYSWEQSLQYRLGFTHRAVVNDYFSILLEAMEHYCLNADLPFRRLPLSTLLFLSHDIDRIRKYSFRNVVHTKINIFRKGHAGKRTAERIRNFRAHLAGWLLSKKDPYRNFRELMTMEKNLGLHSTWYLLEQRGGHNSKYHFSNIEIRELADELEQEGHEVGLHGTLESSGNAELLKGELRRLNAICNSRVAGCRQHFLRFTTPQSVQAQIQAGLSYDASLGFPGQIGFRHGYAHPFRLYNFERDCAMELWQLPLVAMDVSLLEYMKIGVADIPSSLEPLLEECQRVGGVFSLLWHNCRLDEEEYPGIGRSYKEILEKAHARGFKSLTGNEIVKKKNENS